MNNYGKIAIVVVLIAVVGVILASKQRGDHTGSQTAQEASPRSVAPVDATQPAPGSAPDGREKANLPRLVDLGAGKCIPCKMMAPILEELKEECAGRMEVQVIDVLQNPNAGREYRVGIIPTQIFFDASGKERFRHEGFYSKKDILKKCEELGFNLDKERTNE